MANFATAVPFSRDQLARDVRQYQYYPNYNYQQYGNGYYPQYGQYQYDGQNQQGIYDICDDRAFQDKNLMQLLSHLIPFLNPQQPPNRPLPNRPPPNVRPTNRPLPYRPPQRSGMVGFFNAIKMLIQNFFGDKSFGGIVNKSTGQNASCDEVKSFVESEYRKFQQNPQGYASQVRGYQGQNTGYPNYGQPYGTYTGYNQGYTQNVYQGYPYYGPYQQYGR